MKRMKREFFKANKIAAQKGVQKGLYAIYKTRQGLEFVFHQSYRSDIMSDIERQIEKSPSGSWWVEKVHQ